MIDHIKVLWALRIHGPCSISDLAEHVHYEPEDAFAAVYVLYHTGMAAHVGPESFDATDAGRAYLAELAVDRVVTTPEEALREMALFCMF